MGYREAAFQEITRQFVSAMERHGFRVRTTGADKHGSYVWEAGAHRLGLNRYITVGVMPLAHDAFDVEIVVGADDGHRFTSHTVGDTAIECRFGNAQELLQAVARLRQVIEQDVIAQADAIRPADLDDAYIVAAMPPERPAAPSTR